MLDVDQVRCSSVAYSNLTDVNVTELLRDIESRGPFNGSSVIVLKSQAIQAIEDASKAKVLTYMVSVLKSFAPFIQNEYLGLTRAIGCLWLSHATPGNRPVHPSDTVA
jgi:hypothetical protein